MNKTTIEYYNNNATEFVANTENADVSAIRNRFLKLVPDKGYILDMGCGSGRDTLAFKQLGYEVDAIDASEKLCEIAGKKAGIKVKCMSFDQLNEKSKYDGIWACASLLHLKKDELPKVLELAKKALKKDGVIYMSFKYGDFEGERSGRYFTDMTEDSFGKLIEKVGGLKIVDQWITGDVRAGRGDEAWLNVVVTR